MAGGSFGQLLPDCHLLMDSAASLSLSRLLPEGVVSEYSRISFREISLP